MKRVKRNLNKLSSDGGRGNIDVVLCSRVAESKEAAAKKRSHPRDRRPRAVRLAWATGGFLAFGLGALGAVLPLLPTIPFLLGAAFCFARSSETLDQWFRSTKLYREVLQGYVARRAMTLRSKVMLLAPVTILLGVSFLFMEGVPVGRALVMLVWVAHIVYFGFVVETARDNASVVDIEGGR
ncbi:MAG: YbaN family protein [Gordonibacter sp.]|nr:YbaN family protein [Gordonibacter sp.]